MSSVMTHLPHFEDLVLMGMLQADRNTLDRAMFLIKDICNAQANVRYKIDGRPAIILGSHKSFNDGKFFVKTKWSNCPPISSADQIPAMFDDDRRDILTSLITELANTKLDGIYHADLLYHSNNVLRANGKCTFAPNTIEYTIPETQDLQHNVGLCVHSTYDVLSNTLVHAPNKQPDFSKIKGELNAFLLDNEWNPTRSLNDHQMDQYSYVDNLRTEVKNAANTVRSSWPADVSPFRSMYPVCQMFQVYVNTQYRRDGVVLSADNFEQYVNDCAKKAAIDRKTPAGRERARAKFRDAQIVAKSHKDNVDNMLNVYSLAKLLKQAVIELVGPMPNVTQFIEGQEAPYGEGIVATSTKHNVICKFVPRETFSRANFRKNDNV